MGMDSKEHVLRDLLGEGKERYHAPPPTHTTLSLQSKTPSQIERV
jgi:hypothetical protein